MDEEHNFVLKPSKISSLKMLFFAALPDSWKNKLNNSRCKCLKRGKDYRLFENGIKEYEKEIDIVTLIRELRWLKMAMTELTEIPGKPDRIKRRAEFSKKFSIATGSFLDDNSQKLDKTPQLIEMTSHQ